jgi:hypothetical protein
MNNINAINDCKVKECQCDVMTIISNPKPYSIVVTYFIDLLIILSLISLTTSIIVIFLVVYKRQQPTITEERQDYNILAELHDISEITYDKDIKSIDESDYEIMTTNPHSGDKETNIRDF